MGLVTCFLDITFISCYNIIISTSIFKPTFRQDIFLFMHDLYSFIYFSYQAFSIFVFKAFQTHTTTVLYTFIIKFTLIIFCASFGVLYHDAQTLPTVDSSEQSSECHFLTPLQVMNWARKAGPCFHLIPVPGDPFALPFTPGSDPLRGPIFVPMNIGCLSLAGQELFEGESMSGVYLPDIPANSIIHTRVVSHQARSDTANITYVNNLPSPIKYNGLIHTVLSTPGAGSMQHDAADFAREVSLHACS